MELVNSKLCQKFVSIWRPRPALINISDANFDTLFFIQHSLINGLNFIGTLVITRLLFPHNFGLFALVTLFLLITDGLAGTLNDLFFSLFKKIKDDKQRIRSMFLKVLRIVLGTMLPVTFGLLVLAPEIVRYIFGERWLEITPVIYVVIIYGLVQSLGSISTPLLRGIGKSMVSIFNLATKLCVILLLIFPLVNRYGTVGATIIITLVMLISEIVLFFQAKKELNFGLVTLVRNVVVPLVASLGVSVLIFYLKTVIPISNILTVLGFIGFGGLLYFFTLLIIDNFFGGKFYEAFIWLKINA